MIKNFKRWVRELKTMDKNLEKADKDEVTNKTIYGDGLTVGEIVSFQKKTLATLKFMIITPFLDVTKRIIGRHLKKSVPDEPHLVNLKVFDESWEKSLVEWSDVYIWGKDKGKPKKFMETWMQNYSVNRLNDMKSLFITAVMSDSAYFEFFNVLMFNMAKDMVDKHGSNPAHVLYKAKHINDATYFVTNTYKGRLVLKERVKELRTFYDKNGNLKYGGKENPGHVIHKLANELMCKPDFDSIIKEIASLIGQNNNYKHLLLGINQNVVNNIQEIDKI